MSNEREPQDDTFEEWFAEYIHLFLIGTRATYTDGIEALHGEWFAEDNLPPAVAAARATREWYTGESWNK